MRSHIETPQILKITRDIWLQVDPLLTHALEMDPEARGEWLARLDKTHPERAFSRLGPLSRRYPHASTVRFHLGLLLLYRVQPGTSSSVLVKITGSPPTGKSRRCVQPT